MRLKVHSLAKLNDGRISLAGSIVHIATEKKAPYEEEVRFDIESDDWDRIVHNADYWRGIRADF